MKITLEIEVKYEPYDTKAENKIVDKAIKKWILDTVKDNLYYIPFYTKDESGLLVENCTQQTKIKVKK